MVLLASSTHTDTVLQDGDVVTVLRADYHAYDNAWSVYLSKDTGYVDDVLIVEVCRPPCSQTLVSADDDETNIDCAALLTSFNHTGWYNVFLSSQLQSHSQLCDSIRQHSATLQSDVNRVLDNRAGAALVRLRAPLVLVIFNDEHLVDAWSSSADPEFVALTVRVSRVYSHQSVFAVHRSLLRLRLGRPMQSLLTLSLQNPCTALGFSAPAYGSVASVDVRGRQRCMWNCRGDRVRTPYNAAPPTREQLNVSSPQHAALLLPYECRALPSAWAATFFELTLETSMLPSDSEYAQPFYDTLDLLAAAVERNFTPAGSHMVLLATRDSPYHPVSFEQWARDLLQAACATSGCGVVRELTNPHFFYQRRLLAVQRPVVPGTVPGTVPELFDVRVEGVCISSNATSLQTDSGRMQLLTDLRARLAAPRVDGGVDIKGVVDVDFSKMLFVDTVSPAPPPSPPPSAPASPPESADVDSLLSAASFAALALGVAVAVSFAVLFGPRLYARVRAQLR
jgi:hypothetical protein